MATTLDHISGGRAILGIGAAWFAEEHEAFGLRFGDGPPERLRWLGEALPILRGMLDGTAPSATGPRYGGAIDPQPAGADPAPPADPRRGWRRAGHAQARRPVRRREQRRRWDRERPAQGGDPARALRGGRPRPARDRAHDRPSAPSSSATTGPRPNGCSGRRSSGTKVANLWTDQPVGTPEDVAERLAPYLELGYRHFIAGLPATYDEESMTRLISEVKPLLERAA